MHFVLVCRIDDTHAHRLVARQRTRCTCTLRCATVLKQAWMLQVVVLGKSLGGAVALHLAASNPETFKAIVIENTFLSIEDVAPKVTYSPCTLQ